MKKLEKFLIYVPFIGIFTLLNIRKSDYYKRGHIIFEDVSYAVYIQVLSVIFVSAMAGVFLSNLAEL